MRDIPAIIVGFTGAACAFCFLAHFPIGVPLFGALAAFCAAYAGFHALTREGGAR